MEVNSHQEAKLRELYAHHKRITAHWEVAFIKSRGQKPTRHDLATSPQVVRDSYSHYYDIKKVLTYLDEQKKNESTQRHEKAVIAPTKIFRKIRIRSYFELKLGSEKTPHKKKDNQATPSESAKKRSTFYKRMSSKLLTTSNELGVSDLNLSSTSQRSQNSDSEDDTGKGETMQSEPSEFESSTNIIGYTSKVSNLNQSSTSNPQKARKSLPFSFDSKIKERTSDVSALSHFVGSYDEPSGSYSVRDRANLRKVDDEWLKRLDQEVDSKLDSDQTTSEIATEIPQDVPANSPEKDVVSSAGDNFEPDADNNHAVIESLNETAPCAVFDTQEQEYSGVLDWNTDSQESENNSFLLSMDLIREIVKEVSQSTSSQSNQLELEPTYLDPYAFDPVMSEKENVLKNDESSNPKKRPNSDLDENDPEEKDKLPKRKFFKHKTGGFDSNAIQHSLRTTYKPLTPVKRKAQNPPISCYRSATKRRIVETLKTKTKKERSPKVKSTKKREGKKTNVKTISSTFPTKKKSTHETGLRKKRDSKYAGYSHPESELPSSDFSIKKTPGENLESDIYDEVMTKSKKILEKRGRRVKMTTKEYLQMKVNTGKVNENFVRIDVGKKVFVRGRKGKMTGAKMKRLDWKTKKSMATKESKIKLSKCRKCGDIGHFAKFCMQDQSAQNPEAESTECSPFPTLQEAARMIYTKPSANPTNRICVYKTPKSELEVKADKSRDADSEFICLMDVKVKIEKESLDTTDTSVIGNSGELRRVDPVFSAVDSESHKTNVLQDCLHKFGFRDFRPGQQEAVTRTLEGLSTLVVLSTGTGKSLCYQLPAYLYSKYNPDAITLCVSPLVSLMEDQVATMPPFIRAACLHTMMTVTQREIVLEKVRKNKVQILLVSPEAICSGLFGLLRDVESFPPVAFACIDEIHCVSEWSHNFRPSYLKLCKILRDKLHVPAILGLTATATNRTSSGICKQLMIDPSTVIRGEIIPTNLYLSVSRDPERDDALIYLLSEGRFKTCESIIIYCTRREECERVATLIRTKIQTIFGGVQRPNLRQRISNSCEAYHAGMSGARRRLVQNHFMSGKIRIVVATVAFGMGIDKSDIRAVIHYNMPKTFESYVQEIGRAGRDGLQAHCHLFLDSVRGRDLSELKRHVYGNSVDRATVRKLIRKIYKPCKCAKIELLRSGIKADPDKSKSVPCPGHEVSFSVANTANYLDLPVENIETLLCYLELDASRKWIEILPKCYQLCKIQSYGGSRLLRTAAQQCPAIAVAIALQTEKKKFKENDIFLEFNMVEVAASVGWSSAVVRRELKKLEWTGTEFDEQGNPKKFRKSGLLVEFTDLAHRLIAPGDITDDEFDSLLDLLHGRNLEQEKTQLYQLHRVHQALFSVSTPTAMATDAEFDEEKCNKLKKFIYEYFHQNSSAVPQDWNMAMKKSDKEEEIRRDIRNLLISQQDCQFTGRAIARIFQGISSPCFPSEHWYRNRAFWRRYLDVDFHFLSQIASQEIISFE